MRSHRRLGAVLQFDQTIDGRTTATAGATGAARLTHLVSAARAIGDASSDHGVVHGMAVANEHGLYIAPRS